MAYYYGFNGVVKLLLLRPSPRLIFVWAITVLPCSCKVLSHSCWFLFSSFFIVVFDYLSLERKGAQEDCNEEVFTKSHPGSIAATTELVATFHLTT